MTDILTEVIIPRFNFWIFVVLMMIGLYAMIAKKNLIKKLIGMSIFQSAIILFFISVGVKENSTIPILTQDDVYHSKHAEAGHETSGHDSSKADHVTRNRHEIVADDYANPLPHVLMLTAIVVGVSTLGVALAVTQVVYGRYGSLEEDVILSLINNNDA